MSDIQEHETLSLVYVSKIHGTELKDLALSLFFRAQEKQSRNRVLVVLNERYRGKIQRDMRDKERNFKMPIIYVTKYVTSSIINFYHNIL